MVVASSARFAEQAGKRGDGFEQQGVEAGLLVGGAAGVELSDGAAVLGLSGELAYPGGDCGAGEGPSPRRGQTTAGRDPSHSTGTAESRPAHTGPGSNIAIEHGRDEAETLR